jgi:hypothetical protein
MSGRSERRKARNARDGDDALLVRNADCCGAADAALLSREEVPGPGPAAVCFPQTRRYPPVPTFLNVAASQRLAASGQPVSSRHGSSPAFLAGCCTDAKQLGARCDGNVLKSLSATGGRSRQKQAVAWFVL